MRSYDEPIDVRPGRVGAEEGPEQFWWRGRPHRVRRIQRRWSETPPWWESDAVRAARGEFSSAEEAGSGGDDLVAEREVWRVEALTSERSGNHEGVYELAHDWSTGTWRLLRVVD